MSKERDTALKALNLLMAVTESEIGGLEFFQRSTPADEFSFQMNRLLAEVDDINAAIGMVSKCE